MAHYLVRGKPRAARLQELEDRLRAQALVDLEPFGRALTKGLRNARVESAGAVWEEEDYCSPPLAEERAAVLDAYFDDLRVEPVSEGGGWQRIAPLPRLFPSLDDRS
jgi:hypothetical protein